jgi:hypothetical protein
LRRRFHPVADLPIFQEIFGGKHKIYHVKPLKVLTPESVQKLKDDDENLLNSHHVTVRENVPTLSVHFENGEFRELDKYVICAFPRRNGKFFFYQLK